MTKSQFTFIRSEIKKAIKHITEVHRFNKQACKDRFRYGRGSAKHDPSFSVELKKVDKKYSFSYQYGDEDQITALIVYYNKFRGKGPHTHDDSRYNTSKIENFFDKCCDACDRLEEEAEVMVNA
jgi:hypothetical protein